MSRVSIATEDTTAAAGIDLAHNSPAHETRVGRPFHHADELMSNSSFEAGVTTSDFNVRVAYPAEGHTYNSFFLSLRFRNLGKRELMVCVA
jgi:hypothetical protein